MPESANLVHEQSSTTGTGNFTLAAVNGKQRFSEAFGTGAATDVFDYFISNRAAGQYERGTGHMSDATTLVRDTVIESTNSDLAVDFSAGTKDVTNDVPAGSQVRADANITDGAMVVGDGGARGVQGHASGAPGTAAFKNTGTSGDAVPLLNGAPTWSGKHVWEVADGFEVLTLYETGVGPNLCSISFRGDNDAAESTLYGDVIAAVVDDTDAAESGKYSWRTIRGGTFGVCAQFGAGVTVGNPTGGDVARGTLNAEEVRDDNTVLTDMVGDFLRNGKFDDEDVARYDAMVPDRVVPEIRTRELIFEDRQVEKIERQADGSHVLRRKTEKVQKFDRVQVKNESGDPIGEADVPASREVFVPERRTKRKHYAAHLFKQMIDEGFKPGDPASYVQWMDARGALPGMPNEAEWAHNKFGLGVLHTRSVFAQELLAAAFKTLLEDHEARLAALEGAR